MLPDKTWKGDAIIRLFLFLFVGVLAGVLLLKGTEVIARYVDEPTRSKGSGAVEALLNLLASPARMDQNLIAHIVSFLCLHGLGLVWITFFLREHGTSWAEAFGLHRAAARSAIIGFVGTLFALPIVTIVIGSSVMKVMKGLGMEPSAQSTVTLLQANPNQWQMIFLGVVAVGLAPFAEEALFRGILYPALKQRGYRRLAWWGTAIAFGLIHFNAAAFLPLTFLALVLTWLYERTQNLLAPIAGHCLFNGLNFIALVSPPDWLKPWLNP